MKKLFLILVSLSLVHQLHGAAASAAAGAGEQEIVRHPWQRILEWPASAGVELQNIEISNDSAHAVALRPVYEYGSPKDALVVDPGEAGTIPFRSGSRVNILHTILLGASEQKAMGEFLRDAQGAVIRMYHEQENRESSAPGGWFADVTSLKSLQGGLSAMAAPLAYELHPRTVLFVPYDQATEESLSLVIVTNPDYTPGNPARGARWLVLTPDEAEERKKQSDLLSGKKRSRDEYAAGEEEPEPKRAKKAGSDVGPGSESDSEESAAPAQMDTGG